MECSGEGGGGGEASSPLLKSREIWQKDKQRILAYPESKQTSISIISRVCIYMYTFYNISCVHLHVYFL